MDLVIFIRLSGGYYYNNRAFTNCQVRLFIQPEKAISHVYSNVGIFVKLFPPVFTSITRQMNPID